MEKFDLLKFPIGRYVDPKEFTEELLLKSINSIESFPQRLIDCVKHFKEDHFNTPYRPKGWTVRQLVNHCADSHMNSLMRLKWSLTEDTPTIKAYNQNDWAELADSTDIDPKYALQMIEGIHGRWTFLLRSLNEAQLNKTFFHPETKELVSIRENICTYAWHCEHHLAHILELKKRMKYL